MNRPLIIAIAALLMSNACSRIEHANIASDNTSNGKLATSDRASHFSEPQVLATMKDSEIKESSGIVASRRNPGLLWTHNDSGDGPFIYALDLKGHRRGTWRVLKAQALDWEDIAIGPGPESGRSYIYIGDIGDNQTRRSEIIVYRVPEPVIKDDDSSSSKSSPKDTEPAQAIRLKYPDGKYNAETLLVHPTTGDLYIVTKSMSQPGRIYKLSNKSAEFSTLVYVGQISVSNPLGGLITGGDISPDGMRVVLCDYFAGYELVLPTNAKNFDLIWKQTIGRFDLGSRKQGEAICYSLDGNSVLATSEGVTWPLIEAKRSKIQ